MIIADRLRKRAARAAMTAGGIAIAGAIASSGLALPASAAPAAAAGPAVGSSTTAYNFRTLDDAKDLTFNQLLGINTKGLIAGYFGSGAQYHQNKGYLLNTSGSYTNENFPSSDQTQVTGLNDEGDTVGFWSSMNNANLVNNNYGWWSDGKHFYTADYPTTDPATPPVDQLLGINNAGLAVGFYTDATGNNNSYTYNTKSGKYSLVEFPSAVSSFNPTATAINNNDDTAGFYTDGAGHTHAFLYYGWGGFTQLDVNGASSTQAFGVNDSDEVVGVYTDGTGSSATMHGFTWKPKGGFQTVDDPNGIGTTTVNGVNNAGDLVGFYTDSAGNTDGFEAAPVTSKVTLKFGLTPMPQGQLVVSSGKVTLLEYGFTPGSSHEVAVSVLGMEIPLGTLTANSVGAVNWSASLASVNSAEARASAHRDSADVSNPAIELVILNASAGTHVIAQTSAITGLGKYAVHGVEAGYGVINPGSATFVYNPATATISITVNATGLTPGAHAAHIHVGSCQQQGGVAYMLMPDFTANSHGVISNETRTVTGVRSVELSGGWYLNLHQGNSSNILSNGQPTINFRPLECANI